MVSGVFINVENTSNLVEIISLNKMRNYIRSNLGRFRAKHSTVLQSLPIFLIYLFSSQIKSELSSKVFDIMTLCTIGNEESSPWHITYGAFDDVVIRFTSFAHILF